MSSPLAGIRILDLTRVLAGPWATQTLCDLGAEVIKIEKPGSGDDTRRFGPPFLHDKETGSLTDAAYFISCNRGKQSVELDFTTAEGSALVRKLASTCDVLVENYKVGSLAKYGLDYASLHAEFPHLIYCSVTGFGQTGPYRSRAGYDYLIQGMGGLMSVTGERDDRPGGGPQRVGIPVCDLLTGMYACVAILAALRHRDLQSVGQHIDIGMFDVQAAALANQAMNYLTTGQAPVRTGNGHPNIAPYQVFAASDGHLILAVGNDAQFERMGKVMKCEGIAADPRFRTIPDRVKHRDELTSLLQEIVLTKTVDEWIELMERAQIPCGPINTIDRVFADPQIQARNMMRQLPHRSSGSVPSVVSPINFSESALEYRNGPPVLGEHTDQILRRILGLNKDAIATLRAKKIIGQRTDENG
jgi:crotonobetainyl-CoA:carnitine CoA-transferase CaiB-like acyl-CoA transferase